MGIVARGALFVVLMACVVAIVLRRTRGSTIADPDVTGSVTSEHGEVAALDALRKAGNDLSKPSEITYYLDFPDGISADKAADSVRTLDFHATVISGRDGVYACIASKRMIPERSAILAMTAKLTTLAKSLGGHFDRWEAEVAQ